MSSIVRRSSWFLLLSGTLMAAGCGSDLVAGEGTPEIVFTSVPVIGSFENLEGEVRHVIPGEHALAVYILVGRGWWTKPTFADPLTAIRDDGTWVTDITTGGIDETASSIAAFLVPVGYDPPRAGGLGSLPDELSQNAVTTLRVNR